MGEIKQMHTFSCLFLISREKKRRYKISEHTITELYIMETNRTLNLTIREDTFFETY